jgi:uncharacterized protein (DUF1499 family)/multisubunit Na+/H+ antiporter MnhE subunit
MKTTLLRQSRTRYLLNASILVVVALSLWLAAAPGLGLKPFSVFQGFGLGLLLCLLITVISLAALLWGLIKRNNAIILNALLAAVIAATPVLTCVYILGPARLGSPPIHDISTDLTDPPSFTAARALRTAQENTLDYEGSRVANIQRRAYPDIKPLLSPLAPAAALAQSIKTARRLHWRLLDVDPVAGRLEASESTPIFGFTDDIAVRIRPHGTGSRIDIRSVSRVGVGDFGANADRVRRFTRVFMQ